MIESGKRTVVQLVDGDETSDGAGVRLRRIIGGSQLREIDPFLLFDEFKSDDPDAYIGGFPNHPHRGFETVTYLLHGRMRHSDSRGHSGLLLPGSLQVMTAGRGIIHSEMPEMENGLLHGYQLWINLPAAKKMEEPRYVDIPAEAIPVVEKEGASVHVIGGAWRDVNGPVRTERPLLYLDVTLEPSARFECAPDRDWSGFCYTVSGEVSLGETPVPAGRLARFSSGDGALSVSTAADASRFLLLAAPPIGEPIARGGPFVMNTRDEIVEAFRDFEMGRIG